ncbi:EamA family transporter [Streptomyces sp. FXJ1.172]|uniref:EamA family transporter n=1 Tax=Streptomyces sp. FXJ1.172 TaxID=710705 RepID=UPI00099FCE29|nr:EamA family transporter [Streptomyces sp. FXJ1.172]WEO93536.1 EamA family transporter [Streptomyces sp. FXJ1.172]
MSRDGMTRAYTGVVGKIPAPGLVLGGVCGVQFGAALAPRVYPQVGAAGVVLLRLLIAGVLLCLVWRPRRGTSGSVRDARGTVLGAGALLAGHHLAFYAAVERIPLGAVATIEFLGPFVIALAGSRRVGDLLPACLAAGGVLLLGGGGVPLNPGGLALAFAAACCWAGYILVSARMARRISGGQGLALAVLWAALLSAPYGIAHAGSALLSPHVLGVAVVVAVASSVLPYSLNLEALRRIPPRVFGVLTSLEPAVGALFGLLILGQHLARPQWLGIATVACASVTATLLGAGERRGTQREESPGCPRTVRGTTSGDKPNSRASHVTSPLDENGPHL